MNRNILIGVVAGVGSYFGYKLLTGKEPESEDATFLGGGSNSGYAFEGESNDYAGQQTTPTVYNITVESADVPSNLYSTAGATAENETKKQSKSSAPKYFSTNRQTASTINEVDLSKTSASDVDRFAVSSGGAYIDRNAQQSISKDEADRRASNPFANVFKDANTKKEEKTKVPIGSKISGGYIYG